LAATTTGSIEEVNVADGDTPNEGSGGLDAAALRAKLGLGGAATPAASEAPSPAPAYDDDATPVPSQLTDTLQDGDVQLDLPGGDRRIPLKPAVVATVIVAFIGILLGQVLGDSLAQREQKVTHQEIVSSKLKMIREATDQSGKLVLESLAEMDIALSDAVRAADELQAAGGDLLKLEKVFEGLLPKLIEFKRDGTFVDPETIMDGITVIYADDLLLEATRFAVRTRHLFDTISMTIDEAKALAKIGQPSGAATQTVYAERYLREVEGGTKIPAARGLWVRDTGKPDLVKLVSERSKKKTMEWQQMVLTDGAKDPVQVPTDRVVSLNMKPMYEKHGAAVRLHAVGRLADMIRRAKSLSRKVAWKSLEQRLQSWSAP
jgi:hypothetical protein